MKINHFTRLLATLTVAAALNGAAQSVVFDSAPASGRFYRIPAIVQLQDGSLLAMGDDRHGSDSDIGGNHGIDIVGRISRDGGATWGETVMIADGDAAGAGFDDNHGDAAAVADRETGDILVMCASGAVGFGASTLQEPLRVGRYVSRDGGATWSGGEATSAIYGIFAGHREVNGLFFSSGRICQSKRIKRGSHYRIYSAIDGPWGTGCLVLYSDDLGMTWQALGGPAARPTTGPMGDEAKVEELPDGKVLLSCRSKLAETSGRLFNIFDYATGTWGRMAVSNDSIEGTWSQGCSCNGELLVVAALRTSDGRSLHLALQSVPRGPGRQRVTIYYKELLTPEDYDQPEDFAWGWRPYQVTGNYSAYSTMVELESGDIAFMHEDCNDNAGTAYYDLLCEQLTLQQITNGRYRSAKQ